MKKTLALAAALTVLWAANTMAAPTATVAANNYGAGAGQIFLETQGNLAPIANTWVQLLSGGQVVADNTGETVIPLSEPGMFFGGIGLIPGATPGQPTDLTLRAWTGAASWDAATIRGEATWNQATGTWDPAAVPPSAPVGADLTNPAITMTVIPEPSTIALGLIGGAALLLFRRK